MHRRTWIKLAVTGAAALPATWGTVAAATTAEGQSTSALEDLVADTERAFAGSMAARDLTAFASHVSAEAVFFSNAEGTQVLRGRSAIVDGWKRFFEGPAAPFSWTPETAQVLDSGTLAMTTGPVRDPNGRVTGRFSSVWRLEPDGKWRVIFDRGCSCACS
jgi:ketosteroid isomerase-like protein